MGSLNGWRMRGLLIIAGMVMVALGGVLSPGVLLIDMHLVNDAIDLQERLDVKVNNASMTHIASTIYILGHALLLGGVFALWPGRQGGSAGDALVSTGLLVLVIAFICGIASAMLDHLMVHIILHGEAVGIAEAEARNYANGVLISDGAAEMTQLITTFIGHLFLAAGLLTRFAHGGRRWSAIAMSLISLAALLCVLVGSHVHEVGIMLAISALALAPITVWLIVLGVWVYNEDPELIGEPATA